MPPQTVTLGCKVNQYETEYVRQGLARLGYREAADGRAGRSVHRQHLHGHGRGRRQEPQGDPPPGTGAIPQAEIIVMGCYATRAADEVAALPGVVEVVTDKRQLPDLLARFGLVDVPDGHLHASARRHRAYVKVQDGCRMQCSYCIIPSVRPPLAAGRRTRCSTKSRRLVEHGHREIVLTGIHLGHYGVGLLAHRSTGRAAAADRREPSPGTASRRAAPARWSTCPQRYCVVDADGEFRVRLSSIEAAEVTPELLAVMARPRRPRLPAPAHLDAERLGRGACSGCGGAGRRPQFLERCDEVRARARTTRR